MTDPNPKITTAAEEEEAHGFKATSCHSCPRPDICDCPCNSCTFQRHVAANITCSYCDTREGVTNHTCKDCAQRDATPCDYCGASAGQICKIGCGSDHEEPEEHRGDYEDYEEHDHEEEEERVQRCSGCRCPMDGDEGWGPSICSRRCFNTVCDGSF
jgi:hypothetical protein